MMRPYLKSKSATMRVTLSVGIGLLVVPAKAAFAAATEEPALHFYNSPAATAAKVPFSQAVRVGDVLYLSGSLGNVPGTRQLVPGGIEAEARQTMENIGTVLKANGLSFDDVFKCTVMLADMSKWEAFNKVYVTYFKPDRLPARSAFGANGLALGAQVELECWAYAGKR
jgi:2-iminobutanoate/2-iminopropanoate deaminase